ncbi:chaplin family protein [Streptomyces sp. NPDC029216]|uniref:chaplin n=1 Tax=Streptomyces sp. NPDC029216 TaxID=3154701 RepID=UPI0033C74062
MRHSRRNGVIAAIVAGGGLAVAGVGGLAHADADAGGSAERSPGLLSGNLVQLPVHVPVNVCGNTVSVAGVLNPAAGNRCANTAPDGGNPGPRPSHPAQPGSSGHGGGAGAEGGGKDSPGVLSGNGIQLPVDLPLNVSGNSVSVVGAGNASHGNTSVNGETPTGGKPPQPLPPVTERPVTERPVTPPAPSLPPGSPAALAHTGSDGLGYLLPGSGALLLGGALLYRRFRVS